MMGTSRLWALEGPRSLRFCVSKLPDSEDPGPAKTNEFSRLGSAFVDSRSVPPKYPFAGQMLTDQITGGLLYGASTNADTRSERVPGEHELIAGRFQGNYVARIGANLIG